MYSFLKQIMLFLIPLLIGMSILFVIPLDKKFAYSTMQKHCRNANWIYHRIYQVEKPIDIALVGSSRTMCDIDDKGLQRRLSASLGEEAEVANLGFCRLGRNFHYTLIKDLLSVRKPKLILLEVRERENLSGHLDFPLIANAGDVLFPPLWVNPLYFKDVATAAEMRLFPLKEKLVGIKRWTDSLDILRPHSFLDLDTLEFCDPKAQAHPSLPLENKPDSGWKAWVYQSNLNYTRTYLEKTAALAQEKGVSLKFLYLREFRSSQDQLPLELDFYRQWGEVLIPPAGIFRNPRHWVDFQHMNEMGADSLTLWLSEQLRESLLPPPSTLSSKVPLISLH